MNAVIKVGGKQYYVTEGSLIFVEKLNANVGDVVQFDQVLMLDSKIGSPYLTGVTVLGKVLKNGKQRKIELSQGLNVMIGDNSIGKSLILESLIDSKFSKIRCFLI